MKKGCFTNKNIKPTESVLFEAIGQCKNSWDLLQSYLSETLKLKSEMKFYGVNYGWALRFIKSGRAIIALYPDNNCFTVQIILNQYQAEEALKHVENSIIKDIIINTESIHEGKWIYLKIDEKFDLNSLFSLINIRIKVK